MGSEYRIKEMAPSERPRERLVTVGAQKLSTAELLAIILRTGTAGENALTMASRMLVEMDGLAGLHRIPYEELCSRRGVGPAKAAQVKAALELANRLRLDEAGFQASINSAEDAASHLQYEMGMLEQEHFRVLLLDTRNRLLRTVDVYQGSLNTSAIRVGEVFRDAVRINAASIIVAHNHPSGDPTPSPEDISVTRAIVEAGKLLDIEVLDHLIIGRNRYVSLKSKGLGFA